MVEGCIDSANWCKVSSGDVHGWAYGDYLNVKAGDEVLSLYPNRETVGVAVIEAPVEESDTGQDGNRPAKLPTFSLASISLRA